MNYLDKLNDEDFKEFIENFLNKNLTFVKKVEQPFGVLVRFCYDKNYSKLHNMIFSNYHVTSNNGVWVSKFWKVFMYKKFGEEYLTDFKNNILKDYKSYCTKEYNEFVERLKSEYDDKENSINSQIKEIKKIAKKQENREIQK